MRRVCIRLTRQRRGCDLNPGPSAPESSTLTTRLPSHPHSRLTRAKYLKSSIYSVIMKGKMLGFHKQRCRSPFSQQEAYIMGVAAAADSTGGRLLSGIDEKEC